MKRRVEETQRGRTTPSQRPATGGSAGSLLALQRMAGNRAVAGLMREPTAGGAAGAHPRSPAKLRITIKGAKQGPFKGTGRDGTIEGWGFHLGIVSPRDAATGEASGKRRYKTITFKKPLDGASPLLMNALTENESLGVRIEFVSTESPSGGAAAAIQETIVLTDAAVASFDQDSDDSSDSVSLVFDTIEMRNEPGGTSSADHWSEPVKH